MSTEQPCSVCSACLNGLRQPFLSPEIVTAYVHHFLSAYEEETVEAHLQNCDACLREVQSAVRFASRHPAQDIRPVPTVLKVQVAALWRTSQPAIPFCSRLIVQLARSGLRLIAQELTAPLQAVQSHLIPLTAYRTGHTLSVLTLDIETEHAEIKANLIQEGERVAVRLTLLGAERDTLARQRVFLRQEGRSLFSAKTDHQGTLQMPPLAPGIYEVACPGIPATFELELRS